MNKFLRENIINLNPYEHWKIYDNTYIKLNANESNYELPFSYENEFITFLKGNSVNNYHVLNEAKVDILFRKFIWFWYESILVDNWSSAILNSIMRAVLYENDKVLTFSPTFLLYKTISDSIWSEFIELPLIENKFLPDFELIKNVWAKLIIICNPNNPTWFLLENALIEKILLDNPNTLVLVDEAYIEFWLQSVIDLLKKYDNLIVTRTFSKAFSLAWVRLWYAVWNTELIKNIKKTQLPYHLNLFSIFFLYFILENTDKFTQTINQIIELRDQVKNKLESFWLEVIHGNTNFLFFRVDNANEIVLELEKNKILVRQFNLDNLSHFIRVTIWTKDEMDKFLIELWNILWK